MRRAQWRRPCEHSRKKARSTDERGGCTNCARAASTLPQILTREIALVQDDLPGDATVATCQRGLERGEWGLCGHQLDCVCFVAHRFGAAPRCPRAYNFQRRAIFGRERLHAAPTSRSQSRKAPISQRPAGAGVTAGPPSGGCGSEKRARTHPPSVRVPAKRLAGHEMECFGEHAFAGPCLLYTSPSPRDRTRSRMPSSA